MSKIVIMLFLLSVFFINFLPVKDTDFGWHYRCGKELCVKNNFSYFLSDYKAANPSFLYDKMLAITYDHFGFIGVSLMGALIMTAAAFIFFKLCKENSSVTVLTFFLTLFLSWQVFALGLRSQILTYLFFLFSLFIIEKAKNNQCWLWLYPPMMLVWTNTHIGFFVGLIVLGLYVVANRFKPYLIFILLLSFIATMINPFNIDIYHEILNHATSPMSSMIAEWTAPLLWQNILITSSMIFFVYRFIKNKSNTVYEILLLLVLAALAFLGVRNLPFFYTVFFYFIGKNLKVSIIPEIFIPLLLAIGLFTLIINLFNTVSYDTSWNEYCNGSGTLYPCVAINNYRQLSGNVYATYEWGGFLIWQKPQIKVYADGRMPAWKDMEGKSPYQDYLYIIQAQPDWNQQLKKLHTDYLLIAPGTFLDLLLQKESKIDGWSEKYRDNIAVIYKAL